MTTSADQTPDLPPPLPRPELPPGSPLLRWPARLVALLVVLPLRAAWEALGVVGRACERLWDRLVLRPWEALCRLLHRRLFRPVGRLLLHPLRWLWRLGLVPLGRALAWGWDHLVSGPALVVWRHLLLPLHRLVLRPLGHAVAWAWHAAGVVLRAVWRVVMVPLRWLHRRLLAPAGRALRSAWRAVGAPLARAAREAWADLSRAFGPRR
ncbi:hypothetical protein [Nocardioides sp. SYSU DS0651]|uniref:hypothetical protein n=1 Tax=Nocardioides sp. SYSU DS0651 TaxID=3415955 RepID=UPI003F4BCEFC